MTTRSQKRKAVAELVSGDFETSVTENFPPETLVASSSKIPRIESEGLAEIKTSLRKEIMSDLTKILAENQKEMLKLIAPLNKKQTVHMNVQDSDSEVENVSVARTSTPVKTHNATNSKTTPINSRNSVIYDEGNSMDIFSFFYFRPENQNENSFDVIFRLKRPLLKLLAIIACTLILPETFI